MSRSILLSSGSNAHGQLSNGTVDDSHEFLPCSFYGFPPGTMPPHTRRVVNIASGANHTVILLETYDSFEESHIDIWGCGDGSAGQLGAAYKVGEASTIFRPIDLSLGQEGLDGYHVKLISACWETTYVALESTDKGDILLSMGSDNFGDLGVGGLKKGKGREITKPFHVVDFRHLTVEGLSLAAARITIKAIASGPHHVVAQLQASRNDDETRNCIVGWGTSRHGQLGAVQAKDRRPIPFLSIPSLVHVDDPENPTISVALGNQHTVFLQASGIVSGLGSNRKGQLNGLESARRVIDLGCTWNNTYVLARSDDGGVQILSTGSHAHGQLGRVLTSPTMMELPNLGSIDLKLSKNNGHVSTIACGTEHVLALVSGDADASGIAVWGWGWNEHGNLGTGKTENVFVPVKIWPLASKDGTQSSQKAIGIWTGSGTSWIYATT